MFGAKRFYEDDLGLSIRKKMRELDLRDCDPQIELIPRRYPLPVDQEDENWIEKMYEA